MAGLVAAEHAEAVPGVTREEQILKAAAKIFREHGYDGAPVRLIAAAVGLGKSGLYHHARDKQELLGKIVDSGISRVLAGITPIVATDYSPTVKLRFAIEQHIECLCEWLDGAFVAIMDRRSLKREHLERFVGKRDRYQSLFRQIIEEGIEAGEFRPVNAKFATTAILQMINGIIYWYNPTGLLSSQQISSEFFDLSYSMLASQPDRLTRDHSIRLHSYVGEV